MPKVEARSNEKQSINYFEIHCACDAKALGLISTASSAESLFGFSLATFGQLRHPMATYLIYSFLVTCRKISFRYVILMASKLLLHLVLSLMVLLCGISASEPSSPLANIADRVNMSGMNMTGMNMSGMHMNQSDLQSTDFRDANLRDAYLKSAWLNHANLSHAILINADLAGASLKDADLRESDLTGSIFGS